MSIGPPAEHKKSITIVSAPAVDELSLRFPPFPAPPQGVAILPFKDFKAFGYKRVANESGQEIEVDAFAGQPTAKVASEEEAAQRRKDKKKRKNAGQSTDANGRLIPWWEEWEESESSRTASVTFNGNMSYVDRVYQAADDFRVGRTWPEIATGVRIIWDHFRVYVGLLASMPIYRKPKGRSRGEVDGPNNGGEASDDEDDAPRARQTNVTIIQDHLEQIAHPNKVLEPNADDSSIEAHLLRAFIDDIEKTVKVFLSSHMRDTGLIWTERNLFIAPTVLHFFLRFMLRNGVFADSPKHVDNLKRAVAIAELATKEMPLTAKLGQILPGKFDLACKECWGTKGSLFIHISATLPPHEDSPNNDQTPPSDPVSSTFEEELKEHDVEVIPSDIVLDSVTARQVLEDNLDIDDVVPVTDIPVAGDPWAAAITAEGYTTSSWTESSSPSLIELLGPTILPLTSSTGIAEFSTRRIQAILPPEISATSLAVEQELEHRFARVVMGPWIHNESEETFDFAKPVITPGSNGAVVAAFAPNGTDVIGDERPYDPYSDNVTVLVDRACVEKMSIGMGLCGTWVQIRRDGELRKHPRESYWYIEDLVSTFPSFYTESDVRSEADGYVSEDTP
ncbi:hypothetical protein HYDPIDRAFT_156232 [Hydnomerulius pinastri MD-312]|uniref:Uncharacterized protein n=1 Tax=Hydnomerulius pinastri MD-312 TaxID=994086 RepID=A0A0C9VCQ9_9AGAM|nr:hypothetical protein HYDPIDRAFT_156232 [Hydnomerulius pinastri MD-312]